MGKETNPDPNPNPEQSTSFSPDGRYLVVLSPESTLKVWDTRSGEIVADWNDSDSGAVYICTACSNLTKKGKKKNVLLVAFGTSTGDVLAVDVLASKRIWTNSGCHSGEVVSLLFSNNGDLLYTAGADGAMSVLSSDNGEAKSKFKASKKRINSLSISHDERFVGVASKKSRIVGLDSKTELVKIPSDDGHGQLISLSDNIAVCSYGNGDIHVYNFDSENRTIEVNTVLDMKHAPIMLECNSNMVLSVSNKGIVYVWNIEQSAGGGATSSKIKIKSERGKKKGSAMVMSAKLVELDDENKYVSVLVAYRTKGCLKFENVEIKDWGKEITIGPEGKVNKTGSDGELKERSKKRGAPDSDSENEEIVGKARESDMEFITDEPTMAEKLASLDLAIGDKEKEKEKEDKGERDRRLTASVANPPSADSVHVLIKQALHADDQSLLLDCVCNRDEKVIAKSISLLTPADVIKLMKFFVLMIQSRGAIVACVIPWLRSLINLKASSIVSHDSSLSLLNSLYQLIDSRVSTFGSALKLSTCIDYHFTEIDHDEADEEAPVIIYEDEDSDEEEEASGDAMETDEEESGKDIDAPQYSDGSEVMSD
ncbi:hypothetical protein LUZ63_013667 [Rhynchospora breviuscula]|uniref:Small-subunit processome Utp12 domain-containing protein n=1 Tax=Rhynchospora breviuscula TaxID=2022672 RepID=A0A9Q0C969_9POAL|nr:hypothetical protein LUZ63_013667 [Rhynchospora breviuscula]